MEIERILTSIRKEEDITTVFVTHDLAQVKRISDRLIFMKGGQICESGPTAELLGGAADGLLKRFLDGELII